MFEQDIPLSRVIWIALAALIVVLTLFNAFSVERGVEGLSATVSSQSMEILANQVQDKIDRTLQERKQDLTDLAALSSSGLGDAALQNLLNGLATDTSEFAWIGVLDRGGGVLQEAGQRPPPESFAECVPRSDRPSLMAPIPVFRVSSRERASEYHLDITVTVPNNSEDFARVLCARLRWQLIEKIIQSVWGTGIELSGTEFFIVAATGEILLGSPRIPTLPPAVEKVVRSQSRSSGSIISNWPDGKSYVVGYARSNGHKDFSGLGWTVLSLQRTDTPDWPLSALRKRIWFLAIFFLGHGIAFVWYLSRVICDPLLRLAGSADAVRKGIATQLVPVDFSYREARLLSHSLHNLIEGLRERERAQAELAASLEVQVIERTRQLSNHNRRLEIANQRAEEAVISKTRFLAAASHDLRQPLQALMLVTRRLRRRITVGEEGALIARVEQSITDLTNMFNALLDMSRLDSGTIEARIVTVSLNPLLAKIADDFRSEVGLGELEFRYRCSDYFVSTDPVLLEAMVRNLLSNATKFTSRGGIFLCARRTTAGIAIKVYDTGPGIEAERRDEIFDEFVRAPMQANGPNSGLGLGLSIVKRHASLIGARVDVASRKGKGSCFTITVPPAGAVASKVELRTNDQEPGYWDRRRVLLLDDDINVLEALAAELEEKGAHVEAFSTIEAANRAIENGSVFDVMIADYDLRGPESGVDFLRSAKLSQTAPFRALVLTGRTDPKTIGTIAGSGNVWLAKPADTMAIASHLLTPG